MGAGRAPKNRGLAVFWREWEIVGQNGASKELKMY